MTSTRAFMNLGGAMDLIKKSKFPLAPVYEAITNSLESLALRGEKLQFSHEITITLYFNSLFGNQNDLEKINITDNGIGFTDSNYGRFSEFFDKSKGYNNKGTGRLQYFHRFEEINVDSVFEENNSIFRRKFSCTKKQFINNVGNKEIVKVETNQVGTTVSLSNYYANENEKLFFNTLTAKELAKEIKTHFLLRFYLDDAKADLQVPIVNIVFMAGDKEIRR